MTLLWLLVDQVTAQSRQQIPLLWSAHTQHNSIDSEFFAPWHRVVVY